jgi:hypothetical protein
MRDTARSSTTELFSPSRKKGAIVSGNKANLSPQRDLPFVEGGGMPFKPFEHVRI